MKTPAGPEMNRRFPSDLFFPQKEQTESKSEPEPDRSQDRISRSRRAIAEMPARGSVDRWGKPRNGLPQRGSLGPTQRRRSSRDRMEVDLPRESAD